MEHASSGTTPRPSLPSAFNLLRQAFSFYAEHWKVVLGIVAIPFILDLITQVVYQFQIPVIGVILGLISILIYFLATAALLSFLAKENQVGVASAYKNGFRLIVPFAWINILWTLALVGGFFLLILPGILLLIWLSLSSYTFFAEERRGTSALVQSWHYVKGYWGRVLWRFVFLGILGVLVLLALGLLMGLTTEFPKVFAEPEPVFPFWLTFTIIVLLDLLFLPVGLIYGYKIYCSLKEAKASVAPSAEESSRLKKWVVIFSIVGLVGSIILFLLFITLIGLYLLSLTSSSGTFAP